MIYNIMTLQLKMYILFDYFHKLKITLILISLKNKFSLLFQKKTRLIGVKCLKLIFRSDDMRLRYLS
jgi:hypothetical protein